ncbi:hypothetical protein OPIT5_13790 [Opitutaceae bacterium TAV5]|nr:hypothetical protein OPIT5_13790 [Opitutaceae bacterium TAV5]
MFAGVFLSHLLPADDIQWTGVSGTGFADNANWSGNVAPADHISTDIASFTGTLTANQPVISGTRSIGGLLFGSTGWQISGGTLKIGSSGVDASAVTSGEITLASAIQVAATQTWLVGTGGTLDINGNAASIDTNGSNPVWTLTVGDATNTGTVRFGSDVASRSLKVYLNVAGGTVDLNATTLTLSGLRGSGTITNSGATAASVVIDSRNADSTFAGTLSGNLSVTMGDGTNTSNKVQSLNGNNSFTGGLTIKSGTVRFGQSTSVGTGTITLGDSAKAGIDATLYANGTGSTAFADAITNAIQVVGTGTNTLGVSSYSPTFSGAITLNNASLTLASQNNNGSTLTITGGITGTGDVTTFVSGPTAAAATSRIVISGAAVNHTGALIITSGTKGAGTLAGTVINAVIGSNVTGVSQTSADSSLTLAGANTYTGNTVISAGNFTLASTGALVFDVAKGNQLQLSTTGTVVVDGIFNVNFGSLLPTGDTSVTLVSVTGSAVTYGSTFAVNIGNDSGETFSLTAANAYSLTNALGTWAFDLTGGELSFVAAAVPEPAAFGLILGFLTLAVVALRRQRNR